jgi:hypothetical protein
VVRRRPQALSAIDLFISGKLGEHYMLSRLTLYARIPELFTANLMPSLPFSREMRRRQLLFCSDLSDFWRATLQQDGRRLTAGDLFLYISMRAQKVGPLVARLAHLKEVLSPDAFRVFVFLQLFVLPQERAQRV